MSMKMKNRPHRYDITRPRPRHGPKYTIYKMRLGLMMAICIKQHLSSTSSSIYEKLKQHWGWVEKSVAYIKKVYFIRRLNFTLYSTVNIYILLHSNK